jgi:hypothetical protein
MPWTAKLLRTRCKRPRRGRFCPPGDAPKKNYPVAGMVSALFCELKTSYAGHLLGLGFWPFFGANCASRILCSLLGNAYGYRDGGKFAADATQLPTGC